MTVFERLGILATHKHQPCPFPDHDDANPSFRIHGDRWICSCGHGDEADAVMRVMGLGFREAKEWIGGDALAPYTPPAARREAIPEPSPTSNYAIRLWSQANDDDAFVAAHLYCAKKSIHHAFGARRGAASGSLIGQGADCIVVPIRNHGTGDVIAIQAINEHGKKQTFGTIGGGYLLLGDERDTSASWCCCEGWSTAHAVRESVRESVVIISFGAGRLEKVAALVAEHHKPERLVIFEEPK